MVQWLVRILGGGLALLGGTCVFFAWRHASIAARQDVYVDFHLAAALLMAPSAVLLLLSGTRLIATPALWSHFPFLFSGRFWRWLLLGLLVIFCALGMSLPGQDQARYPCRGACSLWLALLLTPLLIPPAWRTTLGILFRKSPVRFLDLVVGNCVLLAILLELGLRVLTLWTGQDALLLQRAAGCRLKPGVYPNGLRANSLGFADEEWTKERSNGRRRIAALGDSFSAGTGVAYEDNYLTRLETELGGIDILNFGVCGTGPREYQQLLASLVWEYEPDLILVPIFIGNDITESIVAPELLKFHPDALYLELLARRIARLVRERWRQAAEGHAGDFRMGLGQQFSERTYLELTAGHLVVSRAQQTPTDRARWEEVYLHLDRLVADCRSHEIPVAFVLIPDEFQVNEALRQRALALRGWTMADLDLLLPQRRLSEFCAARGVPCLDMHPYLETEGAAAHIPHDGHWSVHGHEIGAKAIGVWLLEEFPSALITNGKCAHH